MRDWNGMRLKVEVRKEKGVFGSFGVFDVVGMGW